MRRSPDTRTWLEIDLARLRANLQRIARVVAPCRVMVILKADAYGLGARRLAPELVAAGAARIGVASAQEALELLDCGVPLQVLGELLPEEIPELVRHGVVLPAADLAGAAQIAMEAERQQRTATVQLKIDSGMGRLGIPLAAASRVVPEIAALPSLKVAGIYSHFPMATPAGEKFTRAQLAAFCGMLNRLTRRGVTFDDIHIANSDAINNFAEVSHPPFNMVRCGLNLYGVAAAGDDKLGLEPVFSLKTRLVACRKLPAGITIGYDATYRLPQAVTVGTIAAGYADGLPLALSNRGYVLINGAVCPVLGRLSMDYTTVSLAQAPAAQPGDEVVCLGTAGEKAIDVAQWAGLKGTHAYEILCSFGKRVQRCYT